MRWGQVKELSKTVSLIGNEVSTIVIKQILEKTFGPFEQLAVLVWVHNFELAKHLLGEIA